MTYKQVALFVVYVRWLTCSLHSTIREEKHRSREVIYYTVDEVFLVGLDRTGVRNEGGTECFTTFSINFFKCIISTRFSIC